MNEQYNIVSLTRHQWRCIYFCLVIFLLCRLSNSQVPAKGCHFPESDKKPLFFKLGSGTPVGTVVVTTPVEPGDAQPKITSIKSASLPDINFDDSFVLQKTDTVFSLAVERPLTLPPYPSNVTENTLYVTILCNDQLYPLITFLIRHQNQFSPHFYGDMPFKITISSKLPPGSVIETPILAIDWDPSSSYSVTYKIEDGNDAGFFALDNTTHLAVTREQLPDELAKTLTPAQYPSALRLILLKPLQLEDNANAISLYISASDSEIPPLTNYTSLMIEITDGLNITPIIRPLSQVPPRDQKPLRINKIEGNDVLDIRKIPPHSQSLDAVPVTSASDYPEAVTLVTAASTTDNVIPVPISTPKFEFPIYNFTLPENLGPTNFGDVQCADEALVHRPLRYQLTVDGRDDVKKLFKIDSHTGFLTTTDQLDYELEQSYLMQVSCCLVDDHTNCDFSNVSLTVIDLNDNTPQFEKSNYAVEIPIDFAVGNEVMNIKARDRDSNDNGKVEYVLKNGIDFFDINPNSGIVTLIAPLAKPMNTTLTVEAHDSGFPVRRNKADLKIRVHGTNPSSPVFDQPQYEVTRFAPVPAGSILVTLHATDPDPGPEGQIVYHISRIESLNSADERPKFSINTKTGQLSANVRLTAKDSSPTVIVVEALDQSADFPQKAETVVKLNLIAERTEKISFYPLPKRIFISTSLIPGTVVLRMSTSYTEAPQLFTLRETKGSDYFQMIGDELQVKKKLKEGIFNLTMRVDADTAFAEHQLTVVVMTDREKYPVFSQLSYDLKIPVNATYPLQLHVFDATLFVGSVQYSIYPSDSVPKGLLLEPISGKLIATKEFVDTFSNVQPIFTVVRATNSDFPKYYSDVGVIIRIAGGSDNFYFSQSLYQFTVPANAPAGTILNRTVTVQKQTGNDSLEFVINPPDIITIDGNGTLKTLVAFDSDDFPLDLSSPIDLTIYAKSGVAEASTNVQLIIEKPKQPKTRFEYNLFETAINENAESGEVIGTIRLAQNSLKLYKNISYAITEGDDDRLFEITNNGFLMRSEIGNLDRETRDFYNLTVEALLRNTSLAQTKVLVKVADANDNAPKINSIIMWNITEGSESVGSKLQLHATDSDLGENATLVFVQLPTKADSYFKLTQLNNNNASCFCLQAELELINPLSYNDYSQVLLEIEVKDKGTPSLNTSSVVVVNILQTVATTTVSTFSENVYTANITTDIIPGEAILRIEAQNSGNAVNVTYKIIAASNNMFTIDKQTGDIRLADNVTELIPGSHKLTVEAAIGTDLSTLDVIINIPNILSTTELTTVTETNAEVTTVTTIVETTATVTDAIAALPESTTEITTEKSRTTLSLIKVNHPPVFDKEVYEFHINDTTTNEISGRINIFDPDDDKIVLSVEPEEYKSLFSVDPEIGAIVINHFLDKELYTFRLVATDNGIPPQKSYANVTLSLAYFEGTVTEPLESSTEPMVGAISTALETVQTSMLPETTEMSKSTQLTENIQEVTYSETTELPKRTQSTENIQAVTYSETTETSKKTQPADNTQAVTHPETTEMLISTEAITNPEAIIHPETTEVPLSTQPIGNSQTVTSSQTNEMLAWTQSVRIEETTPLNGPSEDTTILQTVQNDGLTSVKTTQAPINLQSTEDMSLVTTSLSVIEKECIFDPVKLADEILVIAQSIQKLKPIYTIDGICSCTSGCNTTFQIANATLGIGFTVNSNGSIFMDPKYVDYIMNSPFLDRLGRLPLFVNVVTAKNTLTFKIFIIFSKEGEIAENQDTGTTATELNQAVTENTSPAPETSHIDGEDKPQFEYQQYTAMTPEGTYKSGTILSMKPSHIKIADKYQKDKKFAYYIAKDEQNLPFYIRNNTAEIIIYGAVDREQQPTYEFDVIAADDSDPPVMTKTHVVVQILDVNDNSPNFVNASLAIPVRRSASVNDVLAVFNATDADEGVLSDVRYSLYNDTELFTINEKSGELKLLTSLQESIDAVYPTAVIASDMGKPALKTIHNFRVEVFEDNQVGPLFREKRYVVNVRNDAVAGTAIMQVLAGVGSYKYELSDSYSGLFEINDKGVLSLAGTPLKTEQNRLYTLNVTASDEAGRTSVVQVEIYLEGKAVVSIPTAATKEECRFSTKQFNTQIYENKPGRNKLVKLTSNCEDNEHKYVITQGSSEFEIDENTGELYAVEQLDREKRSLHFIVVSIVGINTTSTSTVRQTRQANSVIESMRAKLKLWQTLVTVHVLDENDNEPTFVKRNVDDVFVFSVDWQAPLLTPIARIHAEDADERNNLTYYIEDTTSKVTEYFTLNATSGVLTVIKSLVNSEEPVFEFNVLVSDGVHNITSPVAIYKLSPETNVVLLAVDKDRQQIEDWVLERKISDEIGAKFSILVKQPFVGDNGKVDPQKTHLFVYACDEDTLVPMSREALKELVLLNSVVDFFRVLVSGRNLIRKEYNVLIKVLEKHSNNLSEELPKLSVYLPNVNSNRLLNTAEIILIVLCAILLLTACCVFLYIMKFCKKKGKSQVADSEYMVDSQTAGPRPYNVQEINRKTAQSVLSSRPLPNPYETKEGYDAQMRSSSAFSNGTISVEVKRRTTPISKKSADAKSKLSGDVYSIAGPRSKNFSGNVEQVHSLVNRQLQRNATNGEQDFRIDEAMFPVYRFQGYEHPKG